jgi:hypothetical protein
MNRCVINDLGIKNALFVYFHGEFFRTAPAACSFIPLRPNARDPVAHTEPPGHLLPRVGLGKCWPVRRNSRFPRFFSRFGFQRVIDGKPLIEWGNAERIGGVGGLIECFPVIFPVHGNWPMAPTVTETEGRDEPAGGETERDRPDDEASIALWGRPRHFTGPAGLSLQSQVMVSSDWTGGRSRDERVLVEFPANSLLHPLAGKLLSLQAGQGNSIQPIDLAQDFQTTRALFQHNRKRFPLFPGWQGIRSAGPIALITRHPAPCPGRRDPAAQSAREPHTERGVCSASRAGLLGAAALSAIAPTMPDSAEPTSTPRRIVTS